MLKVRNESISDHPNLSAGCPVRLYPGLSPSPEPSLWTTDNDVDTPAHGIALTGGEAMFRTAVVAFVCLLAAACTTTDSRVAMGVGAPRAGATVLVVKPDVQLSLLTTIGMNEPRADWSAQATDELSTALGERLAGSSYAIRPIDPEEALGGRSGQLLRLHEAVGSSIATFEYGPYRLPTKQRGFNWTLGEGAFTLAEAFGADYALFTYGGGSYASGGRIATMVVLSAFGVGIPLGSQQAFVSLVDLRSGQVIWFNSAVAGPHADMRDPEGARSLVESLLKGAPL